MTTTDSVPEVPVPRCLREPLATFFESDSRGLLENAERDASDWATMARWAARAAQEARRGLLRLPNVTDGDGESLASYVAGALEDFPAKLGEIKRFDYSEGLRAEAGLLTLAAEVRDVTSPSVRAWEKHQARLV